MGNSQILSVGSYRPKRLVPNSEIIDLIDSSDEWIQQRTGIQSRRFAGPDETIITMAQAACESALLRAKLTIADIDTVIVATITYPVQAPSAATDLVRVLGNPKIAALIPQNLDSTPEALNSWLEQFGDIFGIASQPQQQANIDPMDLAALRQIDAATSNAISPDDVNDSFSLINNAQSREELLEFLYSQGAE